MTDPEDWGDQLPTDTQAQLRKIFFDRSQSGVTVLTSAQTAFLLARHLKLGNILKRAGAVNIPLLGKLKIGK